CRFILFLLFFFFQAEDGIRDRNVTGVQTCALPISKKIPKRNYTPLIWVLSVVAVIIILGTNYIPRSTTGTIFGMDLTILPLINAILNGLAFILLICALVMVKKGNIQAHRNF